MRLEHTGYLPRLDTKAHQKDIQHRQPLRNISPPSTTLFATISRSWSLDGLRRIADELPSSRYISARLRHPLANMDLATATELLDIVAYSVNMLQTQLLLHVPGSHHRVAR